MAKTSPGLLGTEPLRSPALRVLGLGDFGVPPRFRLKSWGGGSLNPERFRGPSPPSFRQGPVGERGEQGAPGPSGFQVSTGEGGLGCRGRGDAHG